MGKDAERRRSRKPKKRCIDMIQEVERVESTLKVDYYYYV